MLKKNFHIIRKRFLAGILCAGLILSQSTAAYATDSTAVVTATPAVAHSETYSQTADTDLVKGWPEGRRLRDSLRFLWMLLRIPFFIPRTQMTGFTLQALQRL